MYSTARRMALISAICCAVNVMGLILYIMTSATLHITFALSFAIIMFMGTSAAISLMLTIGLRSLCQDLEYEFENNTLKLNDLAKQIKDMEHKL